MKNFSERLEDAVKAKNSCLVLGLDPNPDKMPDHISKDPEGIYVFCKSVMEACADKICGIKIQMAYFEIFGAKGILIVEQLLKDAKKLGLITIVDGKRNDIGSTSEAYAKAYLADGPLGADALTVNAYLGSDGIMPFVKLCEENGRGIFVLVHTSNPSAAEIQDETEACVVIAEKVEEWNMTTQSEVNQFSSVGAVVGATSTDKALQFFREEMPHAWILAPGVGAQGGDMEEVLKIRRNGIGVLIPVSRSVLYVGDGKDFAQKSREEIDTLWEEQKS